MSSYRNAPLSTGHDYKDVPFHILLFRRGIRHVSHYYIPYILASAQGAQQQFTRARKGQWQWKSVVGLPTALVLIWMIVLWWGEVATFRSSVRRCNWQKWEKWPEGASPHHMVLVADPQLVDPHTYPGRPWPLSTITRYHTDYYMRKSFSLLQDQLDPTTIFFLGDLFDGGREWMPPGSANTDPRWRRYGEDYWIKEYRRFGNIFFNEWLRRGLERYHPNIHRKIIAELPGNHDLGLGNGIRLPVRRRFNAFLGEGNRIDVIGNHTFVTLDTVSLSAKGQPDPATGSQGAVDGGGSQEDIWEPVDKFLEYFNETKTRAVGRAIRLQNKRIENSLLFHEVLDIQDPLITKSVHTAYTPKADLPSILLIHVPLYRAAGTPCGPLRERSPPSTQPSADGEYLNPDPQNAIKVEAGIQYQNVLTPEISNEIITKVGGDIAHVFSGDDHDYCEVLHRGYTGSGGGAAGGIREITVKSFSWAMGVRRPGFLMLSLWNPVDGRDRSDSATATAQKGKYRKGGGEGNQQNQTIQTQLCLLPDQLGIFIRYLILLVVTLFALLVRTIRTTTSSNNATAYTNGHVLLPPWTSKPKSDTPPPSPQQKTIREHSFTNGLAVRPTAGRTSAATGYGYGYSGGGNKSATHALHDDPMDERWGRASRQDSNGDVWGGVSIKDGGGARWSIVRMGRAFRRDVLVVGIPVVVWWVWLVGRF